jgi:hypothetical protein
MVLSRPSFAWAPLQHRPEDQYRFSDKHDASIQKEKPSFVRPLGRTALYSKDGRALR